MTAIQEHRRFIENTIATISHELDGAVRFHKISPELAFKRIDDIIERLYSVKRSILFISNIDATGSKSSS